MRVITEGCSSGLVDAEAVAVTAAITAAAAEALAIGAPPSVAAAAADDEDGAVTSRFLNCAKGPVTEYTSPAVFAPRRTLVASMLLFGRAESRRNSVWSRKAAASKPARSIPWRWASPISGGCTRWRGCVTLGPEGCEEGA